MKPRSTNPRPPGLTGITTRNLPSDTERMTHAVETSSSETPTARKEARKSVVIAAWFSTVASVMTFQRSAATEVTLVRNWNVAASMSTGPRLIQPSAVLVTLSTAPPTQRAAFSDLRTTTSSHTAAATTATPTNEMSHIHHAASPLRAISATDSTGSAIRVS